MSRIAELIERLEKATGPDRELDRSIHIAIDGNTVVPGYTESLDAALMLVPSWHKWSVACGLLVQYVARVTQVKDSRDFFDGQCDSTPAIALCIAALKARDGQP